MHDHDTVTQRLSHAIIAARTPQTAASVGRADEGGDAGILRRNWAPLIIGAVVFGGLIWAAGRGAGSKPAPIAKPRAPEPIRIVIRQLPTPLPPPKLEPPKVKKELIAKQPPQERPTENPKPVNPVDAPLTITTDVPGKGGSLTRGPGGPGSPGGSPGGGRTGDLKLWYAGQAGRAVEQALAKHPNTRTAIFGDLEVKVWPDATGRITRAELGHSTGDSALDAAIGDALQGVHVHEEPPAGMKWVLLRLHATAQARR